MPKMTRLAGISAVVALACLVGLTTFRTAAQEGTKAGEVYQAQAMGQGTQLGKIFDVNIHIDQYSTEDDRQALIAAFQKDGSKGLSDALQKMHAKGQLAVTGTVGFEITYARRVMTADGYRIRVLTNRPIYFGEELNNGRSLNYNLTFVELNISDQKNKSTGLLLPAVQFKVDKKTNEVVAETYRNPWKLQNIIRSKE